MRYHRFGTTGRDVAVIGQGTWYIEHAYRRVAVAALRRGLDLGMNHIDTAEMYGDGVAEEVVGEAIAGRRGEVFVVSKVLPHNASRTGTIAACERSLRRLRVERIDCYLLHWRGAHPLAETIAAFGELQRAGKIASWGVSNFDAGDLQEAQETVEAAARKEAETGPRRIACDQVLYHLGQRDIEHAVIPWCETHHAAVVAYSPFGHDRFPAPRSAGGRVLAEIARAHGATPRQVALAFLVRRPQVFAIPKAASPAHVEENAAAGDLQLAPEEIVRIEAAFPLGRASRSLPML
jgi:diketogulonate reductase-like aldo/keto reductase